MKRLSLIVAVFALLVACEGDTTNIVRPDDHHHCHADTVHVGHGHGHCKHHLEPDTLE